MLKINHKQFYQTSKHFFLILSAVIALTLTTVNSVEAVAVVRTEAVLVPIWEKLDDAIAYREGFSVPTADPDIFSRGKTYEQILIDYEDKGFLEQSKYPNQSAKDVFEEIIDNQKINGNKSFRFYFTGFGPEVAQEARLGLQEAQNEYVSAQTLTGNDHLIQGLRARFPGTTTPDLTQELELQYALNDFQGAISSLVNDLRTNPNAFRSNGDPSVNSDFPVFVENTTKVEGTPGPIVENEFYRFTEAVNRSAEAGISLGRRLYFFGNVSDVDIFPSNPNDFPGNGDLDLNFDGIKNSAGRETAKAQLKRAAQETYLNSAMLASLQTPAQFQQNEGYKLKRYILQANTTFVDILSGYNPLKLQGDFIPSPEVNYLQNCNGALEGAITSETNAKAAAFTYDTNQTALASELRGQQLSFIDQIEAITSLSDIGDVSNYYNLLDIEKRELLVNDAAENAINGIGTGALVTGYQSVLDAQLEVERSQELVKQIPARIKIEEDRAGAIQSLITINGQTLGVLAISEAMASNISVSVGYVTPAGFSVGTSFNPQINKLAKIRQTREILSAVQGATIEGINSAATIKQFLLEQAISLIALDQSVIRLQQQVAVFNETFAELERSMRGYVAAREDLAKAYFSNPAYRLERDNTFRTAENTFDSAMRQCYSAFKDIEYKWSEEFTNPVPLSDAGGINSASLNEDVDHFSRAESIFATKTAVELGLLRTALTQWDTRLREKRSQLSQESPEEVSLRRDILGFNGGDEKLNQLLFTDYIKKHLTPGGSLYIEFAIELGDERFFTPTFKNIKTDEIYMDLISRPGTTLKPGPNQEAVDVELVPMGHATIRTFYSNVYFDLGQDKYVGDDDLRVYKLAENRIFENSKYYGAVQATVDGFSSPAAVPSGQYNYLSPSVTRWGLRILAVGDQSDIQLENLNDIKITFDYHWGHPPAIAFPW